MKQQSGHFQGDFKARNCHTEAPTGRLYFLDFDRIAHFFSKPNLTVDDYNPARSAPANKNCGGEAAPGAEKAATSYNKILNAPEGDPF